MERFQLDPFPSSSTDGRLGSAMAKGRAKGTKQQMICTWDEIGREGKNWQCGWMVCDSVPLLAECCLLDRFVIFLLYCFSLFAPPQQQQMAGATTLQMATQQAWSHRALNLLFCASGIIICYGVFSVFQEKITQRLFGEKKERFVYMQALVFCQCATNLLVAWYVLRRNARKSLDNVPNYLYSMCSTSYFLAMLFSSLALEWVNYPTQVLGKSCKPIPIMLFGVLFAHKRSVVASCFYACHWQWTESPELSKIESDIITPLTNGR
uniref:Uncharacterized protein n=1 Tax=Globodera rostochiensis TaxID=31243 RepID=A0A914HL83_GLORO